MLDLVVVPVPIAALFGWMAQNARRADIKAMSRARSAAGASASTIRLLRYRADGHGGSGMQMVTHAQPQSFSIAAR
jgi:hypothetical protein